MLLLLASTKPSCAYLNWIHDQERRRRQCLRHELVVLGVITDEDTDPAPFCLEDADAIPCSDNLQVIALFQRKCFYLKQLRIVAGSTSCVYVSTYYIMLPGILISHARFDISSD